MIHPSTLDETAQKVRNGDRLTFEDGLHLFDHTHLTEIGSLALLARRRRHSTDAATYATGVRLSWEKLETSPDAAERSLNALSETSGSEIRITGEIPDEWDLETVTRHLSRLKEICPQGEISALTPYLVTSLAEGVGYSAQDVLTECRNAGLAALGPWTFESSSDHPELALDGMDSLLSVLRAVQDVGIPSTVRVELPPSDSHETRLIRLTQLRELQNLSGGISTLTPLNSEGSQQAVGSAYDYLRTVAVTRLMVDNVPHIQSSWETHGLKIAQLALQYGADDFGTIWLETLPNASAPVPSHPLEEVERNIQEAGFIPQVRTVRYEPLPSPLNSLSSPSSGSFAPME